MIDVVQRKCREAFSITAQNGDHFEIKPGNQYTTSLEGKDGKVMVFTNFWVRVPLKYFEKLYGRDR